MAQDNPLAEQARGLRADVAGLAKSVTALAGRTAQSERTVARIRRITIALVVVLVLSAVSTGYLVYIGRRIDSFTRCQAAVNEVTVARSRALTEATADERAAERQALDLLFAALFDPAVRKPAAERTAADRERIAELTAEVGEAAAVLLDERARADLSRAAHPPPPPPSQTCGG